ncbi:uncharacterized protein LOC134788128, partial [Penaeus indicus]|uniref:uncharacterized protein LOC134788128 n=1 Tax=Penaeus indicus TaxID=29960 RepID=UPI00300D5F9F
MLNNTNLDVRIRVLHHIICQTHACYKNGYKSVASYKNDRRSRAACVGGARRRGWSRLRALIFLIQSGLEIPKSHLRAWIMGAVFPRWSCGLGTIVACLFVLTQPVLSIRPAWWTEAEVGSRAASPLKFKFARAPHLRIAAESWPPHVQVQRVEAGGGQVVTRAVGPMANFLDVLAKSLNFT